MFVFRHLKLQLAEIENVINKMMEEDFVKFLTAEWNRPVGTLNETNPVEEERLLTIVFGMLRLQRLSFVDVFREEAYTAIKTVIKQTVIEALSREDNIDVGQRLNGIFEQLGFIDFINWLALIEEVFETLLILLKRIQSVHNIMCQGITVASQKHDLNNGDLSMIEVNHVDENVDPSSLSTTGITVIYVKLKGSLNESLSLICDYANRYDFQKLIKSNDVFILLFLVEQQK